MRKQLAINTYTQLNTNSTAYLVQNLSEYDLHIIVSDTEPGDGESPEFIIEPRHGLTDSLIEGILWGKPDSRVPVWVGISEE